MTNTFYHYTTDLTESAIIAALRKHQQRGQKPQQINLNPVNDLQLATVDGVEVEVTEKQKPVNHFGVVI